MSEVGGRAARWLPLLPIALALGAHARAVPAALEGRVHLGGPLAEGDALWAHRFAWETLVAVERAWDASNPISFALAGFWEATASTGALNALDFALLLWPAREWLPPAPAFLAIELGLILAAPLAGVLFAAALGAGPWGRAAAGLVAAGSGLVLHHLGVGQYPQALIAAPLAATAGAARLWRGERGGVALTVAGAVASALLYWQNAVLLGLGGLVWLGVAMGAGERPATGVARRFATAAALAALLLAPPMRPVLAKVSAGHAEIGAVAWGTPLGPPADDEEAAAHLIDEVRWPRLLGPGAGWALPALPLIPLLLSGLRRRDAGWAAVAVLGLVLAAGPFPRVPTALASLEHEGPRAPNPVYAAVYRWVPTASRLRHPNRWGILLLAGTAALVAAGADQLARRRPRMTGALLAGGAAWIAWVGPYPIRATAFPGALLDAVDGCTEIWVPPTPAEGPCTWTQAEGLFWRPRYPATWCRERNVAPPTRATLAANGPRAGAMMQLVSGVETRVPTGTCVVVDEAVWGGALATLEARLGPPRHVDVPAHTALADALAHRVAIFRAR